MAGVKNTFIKSKMNKDLDDRLIPNGEYRDAQNAQISKSEGADVGALENVLGNIPLSQSIIASVQPITTGGLQTHYNAPEFAGLTPVLQGLEIIGLFFDEVNDRVFCFLTNFMDSSGDKPEESFSRPKDPAGTPFTITLQDKSTCILALFNLKTKELTQLINSKFLNFCKNSPILNVNIIEDLLFWTDNRNQPRRININRAIEEPFVQGVSTGFYNAEDHWSVASYMPWQPIYLHDEAFGGVAQCSMRDRTTEYYPQNVGRVSPGPSNPTYDANWGGDSSYLEDKFVRFSYRYKFIDNEYSLMAPFTQVAFIPKQDGFFMGRTNPASGDLIVTDETLTYRSSVVSFMENKVDEVALQIPLPTLRSELYDQYKIQQIEILFKESDSLAVKVIEEIPITPNDTGGSLLVYNYESTKPIRTLPETDTTRVSDRVPVTSLTQETTGNRVLYGNYVKTLPYPENLAFRINISEKLGTSATDFQRVEYPNHSVKQNRSYEVGIVLYDRYGRASNVISNRPEDNIGTVTEAGLEFTGSTIYHPYTDWPANDVLDWTGDTIKVLFTEPIALAGLPNDGIYDALTNPLGWYSYRVVVKQKQQDYYNVYLPGMLKGYPTFNTSTITQTVGGVVTDAGVTSHVVLINDNINKVPRDLQEVGPTQTVFGSKTRLFARVENVATPKSAAIPPTVAQLPYNRPFLPSRTGDQVVSIGTMKDLELGNAAVYFPSTPKYEPDGSTAAGSQPTDDYIYVKQFLEDIQDGMEIATPQDTTILDPVDGPFYIQEYQENPDYNPTLTGGAVGTFEAKCRARFKIFNRGSIVDGTILPTINIPAGTVFTVSNGTFYSSSSNPLIARISTEKPLGSDIFTTVSVNPFFSLYETAPFESQLDLYYETTTSGLIEDLNNAIITSGKPKGVTEWDFVLDEGAIPGDNVTNNFYFTDQLNAPINPSQPPVMTVSSSGFNRTSEFILVNIGPDPDPLIFPGIDRYRVETAPGSYFYYGRAAAVSGKESYQFRFTVIAAGFLTIFDYRGTLGNRSPQGVLALNPSVATDNQVGTFTASTNGSADVNRDDIEFLIELESQNEVTTTAAVDYFILQQVSTGGAVANILINPNNRPLVGNYSITVRLTDALGEGISRVYSNIINITEATLTGSVTTLPSVQLGKAGLSPTMRFEGSQLAINGGATPFDGMTGSPFNLTPVTFGSSNNANAPNSKIGDPLAYSSTVAPIPLRINNPAAGPVDSDNYWRGVDRYTGGWGDDIDNNVNGSGHESWKYEETQEVKFRNNILYHSGSAIVNGQAVLKITYTLNSNAEQLNAFSNTIIQTRNNGQWEELLDINGQPFRGKIYDTAGSFAQYNYDTILLQRDVPQINSQLRYADMNTIDTSSNWPDTGYYSDYFSPNIGSWRSFDPADGINVTRPSGSASPNNGIVALRNYTDTGVNMSISIPFVVSGPVDSIRVITSNHRFGGQRWNGASNSEGGANWALSGNAGESTVTLDIEDYNDPTYEWYEYWLKEVPYSDFNQACVSALTPGQSSSGDDWINLGSYTKVYARSRFYKYVDQFFVRTGSSPADYIYTAVTTSPNNYYAYSGPLNVDPAPIDAGKPTFYGGEKAFGAWNTGAASGIRPVWAFKFNNFGGRAPGNDGIPKPYCYKDNFDINSVGIMQWYVPTTTQFGGSTRDGECENP